MSVVRQIHFHQEKVQVSPVTSVDGVAIRQTVGWFSMRKSSIIIGETYHNLKVIERIGTRPNKTPIWKCECTLCGSITSVSSEHLRDGSTNSCGCLRRKKMSIISKRTNKFVIDGDIVIGYDEQGKSFIFDLEDLDRVSQHYWSVDSRGYVKCVKERIFLHRFILNTPNDYVVDHKNHKTNDNRKCNIWSCTQSDNMYNQKRFHSVGGRPSGIKDCKKRSTQEDEPKRGAERKEKL